MSTLGVAARIKTTANSGTGAHYDALEVSSKKRCIQRSTWRYLSEVSIKFALFKAPEPISCEWPHSWRSFKFLFQRNRKGGVYWKQTTSKNAIYDTFAERYCFWKMLYNQIREVFIINWREKLKTDAFPPVISFPKTKPQWRITMAPHVVLYKQHNTCSQH